MAQDYQNNFERENSFQNGQGSLSASLSDDLILGYGANLTQANAYHGQDVELSQALSLSFALESEGESNSIYDSVTRYYSDSQSLFYSLEASEFERNSLSESLVIFESNLAFEDNQRAYSLQVSNQISMSDSAIISMHQSEQDYLVASESESLMISTRVMRDIQASASASYIESLQGSVESMLSLSESLEVESQSQSESESLTVEQQKKQEASDNDRLFESMQQNASEQASLTASQAESTLFSEQVETSLSLQVSELHSVMTSESESLLIYQSQLEKEQSEVLLALSENSLSHSQSQAVLKSLSMSESDATLIWTFSESLSTSDQISESLSLMDSTERLTSEYASLRLQVAQEREETSLLQSEKDSLALSQESELKETSQLTSEIVSQSLELSDSMSINDSEQRVSSEEASTLLSGQTWLLEEQSQLASEQQSEQTSLLDKNSLQYSEELSSLLTASLAENSRLVENKASETASQQSAYASDTENLISETAQDESAESSSHSEALSESEKSPTQMTRSEIEAHSLEISEKISNWVAISESQSLTKIEATLSQSEELASESVESESSEKGRKRSHFWQRRKEEN
jgi:hypothetical protein